MFKKIFLPQLDGRALDSIKIAAAILMILDHFNHILLAGSSTVMFLLGRGAFPLFCYAAARAVMRAPEKTPRYALVLAIMGGLAQPFYFFSFGQMTGNVLFTLAAGGMIALWSEKMPRRYLYAFFIFAIVSMYGPSIAEFGLVGAALPAAMLLWMRGEKAAFAFAAIFIFLMNMGGLGEATEKNTLSELFLTASVTGLSAFFLFWLTLHSAAAIKGTGRLLPRYFLHIFYPVHMTALKGIALLFK